jgi:hypothetical protein
MVPLRIIPLPEEESMGYQPLPPKRVKQCKGAPKTDNPMDYYQTDEYGARPARWQELFPTSERTGWPFNPLLISGLSKKEQEQAERWFLGLPDGPQGQSNHATLVLMQSLEKEVEEDPFALDARLISGGYECDIPPSGADDTVPDPYAGVFPLKYRSPVISPHPDNKNRV